MIESVAFDGGSPRFADDAFEVIDVEFLVDGFLGRGAAAAFGDVVPGDGAVEVVYAPIQRELGEVDGLHDPEGFDVGDVVEHEAGDGEGFEIGETGGAGEVAELAVVGDEGERDDAVEGGLRRSAED